LGTAVILPIFWIFKGFRVIVDGEGVIDETF
jgi:hypothetical protein